MASPASAPSWIMPEEHEQLRPGAVALVHRVREERGVLAQALVQARERVVAQERLVLRQHVPLLGVEQEDEPQDDGEQRAVDLVGVVGERLAQQLAARGVVRGLEAAQQLVERVQDLLGEPLADLVLELAAVVEQRSEALRARQRQEAALAEQQPQRGRRSAGPPSAPSSATWKSSQPELSPRGAEIEPQRAAVEEQAGRDAGLAQQPLHPPVRRRLELPRRRVTRVEVLRPARARRDEQLPRGRAVGRVELAHGEVGPQRLAVVGQRDLELGRDRALVGAGVALRREAPAEDAARERLEVGDTDRSVVGDVALVDARAQQALPLDVAAVEDRAGAHERGRGDDEAGRLDEAEPLEVREDLRVELGHGHQLVSGQR